MFKSYTRKSSAVTGAIRAGLSSSAVVKVGGKWGFYVNDVKPLPSLRGSNVLSSSQRGYVDLNDIFGTNADFADSDEEKAATAAYRAAKERSAQSSSTTPSAAPTPKKPASESRKRVGNSAVKMLEKVNETLGDIKGLLVSENKREENRDKNKKLKDLESDREKKPEKNTIFGRLASSIKDGGLMSLLKGLSLPLLLGALTGLDKKFAIFRTAREKVSEWLGKLQKQLNKLSEIPLFKDNILGAAIKHLIPIAGAFGLLAIWKPGVAVKMLKGIGKFIKFFGNNPALKWLEDMPRLLPSFEAFGKLGTVLGKLSRLGGKVLLPITVITSLWETVKGAIDGWKQGGVSGALKGALDGLIHGLIGGLVEVISSGIGWIVDQFGGDGSAFKRFNFTKFLSELGSNIGLFISDVIESIKHGIIEAAAGIFKIFNSDESFIKKFMQMLTFPISFIVSKFKETFGGLSPWEALKKMLSFATANHAVGNAAIAASAAPGPKLVIIDPRDPASMRKSPPARMSGSARGVGAAVTGSGSSIDIAAAQIRKHEGFSANAYWDKNAFRAGYGSDTTTLADGTVRKINKNSVVTQADSERDLRRRIAEFQKTIIRQVGLDNWNALNEQTKAALTSVAYNYGSFTKLSGLVAAIKSRNTNSIADAVAALGANKSRRLAEAEAIRASLTMQPTMKPSGSTVSKKSEELEDTRSFGNRQASVQVSPINASRTTVSNQTQNYLPSLSASTPVEFAPHVA